MSSLLHGLSRRLFLTKLLAQAKLCALHVRDPEHFRKSNDPLENLSPLFALSYVSTLLARIAN